MYRLLDQTVRDIRYALRQFRRAPGPTFAAVLALACGIGGVTTVFTLIDAVVLRPLPVSAPGELVWLRDPSFSYPMFEQLRDRAHMLRGLFAWEPRSLQVEWTGEAEPTSTVLVTGAFHDTLGIRPAAGRLLTQADVGNSAAEAQAVAVLSYTAWQRRFAFLGGVALLLACGALGGLMSHMVASRTRESGLRIALGAEDRAVTALVMREALGLAVIGAMAGVGLALAGGRLVAGFLHDLRPTDPLAIGAAATLMLLTATVTSYLPARRAARVDPIEALRAD